jgi:ABC-type branched-subunit amino acid transport system ATPase component/ABC-type branched-subunit amino acid transport system permease subunit
VLTAVPIPWLGFQMPMDIIAIGAVTGIAYSLFGIGISLTYQSSRVINFAQGAMGAVPGLLVASLVVDHGWGYWPALIAALVVSVLTGALMEVGVIRPLRRAPRLVVLVATIAASQLLLIPEPFVVHLNHTKLGVTPYPLPIHARLNLGPIHLTAADTLILILGPLLLVGLVIFLRGTNVGMASRGIAENEEAASLAGVPVRRVSLVIWSFSGLLAGMSAILLGPTQPVLGQLFGAGGGGFASNSDLLLKGLGAAMIGGLVSVPRVFASGLAIGVIEALVRWNYPRAGGQVDLVLVVLIVGSLLLRRNLRALSRGGEESSWSLAGGVRTLPTRIRRLPTVRAAHVALIAVVLLVAFIVPQSASQPEDVLFSAIFVYVLVNMSLVVLTGWAGQISLGQFTFVGLGALVGGRMAQLGYPPFGALIIATTVGALAAFVVGLPALRMRGLFLAVTSLAFAVLVDAWMTQQSWLIHTTAFSNSTTLHRPRWLGVNFQNEHNFNHLMLLFVVIVAAMIYRLRSTGVYRKLIAVRDNESSAAALGVAPAATKLLAFVFSGALASFAGYWYGTLLIGFGGAGLTAPTLSLVMVTMVILGGSTSITGAVLGALYVRGIPYVVHSTSIQLLTSGGGLLLVIILFPGGLAAAAFRARDWLLTRVMRIDLSEEEEPAGEREMAAMRLEPRPRGQDESNEAPPLEAMDIVVRYGGLTALGGVSIRADHGEIVGLIGPNGAGKTTLFDVLTGLVSPDSGRVCLFGSDVTYLKPDQRAQMGLGRSFQQARLFDDLTLTETLKVALERSQPSELVPSVLGLWPSRAAERQKELRVADLLELCGLERYAEKKMFELSTGTKRIAELASVIALEAEVILLDEPTGGVAQREAEAFVPVLHRIRDHLDATLVVVAHDIPLIVDLIDRVYVLSSGEVIASGPPSILHTDPAVIAAYVGIAGSGSDEEVAAMNGDVIRQSSRQGVGSG